MVKFGFVGISNRLSILFWKYSIPNIDYLYSNVSGGRYFTRLDLSDAYLQVPLDEESQKLTTINTHKVLFMYTRLCFGNASSPGVFQRIIDQLIQGIPRTVAYLDDILIGTCVPYLRDYEMLVFALKAINVNSRSRQFHIWAIRSMQFTKHPSQRMCLNCEFFLAFVNYHSRYLNNISTVLAQLYRLLQKGIPWKWGPDEAFAFKQSKGFLMSINVLVYYNTELKLIMTVDASPVGVGAVLSHIIKDGSEKPIYFASRALSKAERNYAQIEREGLAVIFGVSKFHKYIYGRVFTIIKEHKPLLGLFKEYRAISPTGSARVQRWALVLASYHNQLVYKPG